MRFRAVVYGFATAKPAPCRALRRPKPRICHDQHAYVLLTSLATLGVLGPPERMNNLHERTTGLLLGSSRVLVGEPLRGFKVTDGRCSATLDVLDHVLVVHVTGVAGLRALRRGTG